MPVGSIRRYVVGGRLALKRIRCTSGIRRKKNSPSEAPLPKHRSIGPCDAFGIYEFYNALGKTVTAVFASMKLRLVPTILHRRASARKSGKKARYIRQDAVWGQYCRFEAGCHGISLYTF